MGPATMEKPHGKEAQSMHSEAECLNSSVTFTPESGVTWATSSSGQWQ